MNDIAIAENLRRLVLADAKNTLLLDQKVYRGETSQETTDETFVVIQNNSGFTSIVNAMISSNNAGIVKVHSVSSLTTWFNEVGLLPTDTSIISDTTCPCASFYGNPTVTTSSEYEKIYISDYGSAGTESYLLKESETIAFSYEDETGSTDGNGRFVVTVVDVTNI